MKCKILPQEGTVWKPQCQVNSPGLPCLSLIPKQCPSLTLDRKDGTWKILKSPWHTAESGPVRLSVLCYPKFRGLSSTRHPEQTIQLPNLPSIFFFLQLSLSWEFSCKHFNIDDSLFEGPPGKPCRTSRQSSHLWLFLACRFITHRGVERYNTSKHKPKFQAPTCADGPWSS